MINKNRIIKNFTDICEVDSLSGKEKNVALVLKKKLEKLGAKVVFDKAGKKVGGNTGNLIAKLKGSSALKPFLLAAHMDTVPPGEGIKPVLKRDRIVSKGNTVLGADCKSGIAVILEILSVFKEKKIIHPPIEIVFSVCEEIGLLGAKFLDYSKLKAGRGLVFDSERPLNEITAHSPAADKMEMEIYGKSAHAGVSPETGVSAIKIASDAISKMRLGRIDFETTANIGMISGGEATNIITPLVKLKGEARSHKLSKLDKQTNHMRSCVEDSIKKFKNGSMGPRLIFKKTRSFMNLNVPKTDPVVKAIGLSMKEMGMKLKMACSGGGTDANIFYGHKIKTPILATGMRNVHTTNEHLLLNEFFDCAELAIKVIGKM